MGILWNQPITIVPVDVKGHAKQVLDAAIEYVVH